MTKEQKKRRLEELRERLQLYLNAEKKILQGQSYTIGSRQLERANLATVQKKISVLQSQIDAVEATGTTKRRAYRAVPFD
jgi:hypothetical protein